MKVSTANQPSGWLYGIAAYGLWGIIPLYFEQVNQIPPHEILAHRILWSGLLLIVIVTILGRWGELRSKVSNRAIIRKLFLSTIFIASNWYVFIYSVVTGQTLQGSLGYFILPLVNVAFGVFFFGERLRRAQWTALFFAALGVLFLVVQLGDIPWISFTLAISFAIYGVIRKQVPVDAIIGLSVETLLLTPIAIGFLIYWQTRNQLLFLNTSNRIDFWIAMSGIVTTIPLLCYGLAIKKLHLISVGFLQYISPSIAMMIAVFHFREPFTVDHQISFGLIWFGLLIFIVDAIRESGESAKAREIAEVPEQGTLNALTKV